MKSRMKYSFQFGKVIESEQAVVSLASHSLQYGTTVFGGMRGYIKNGKATLFRIKDHHKRLMEGAKIFGMDYYMDFEDFKKTLIELIRANQPDADFYIRPFIYTNDEVIAPKFHGMDYDLGIYMIPLGDFLDTTKGLRLMISTYKKFSDMSISTKAKAGGAYLNSSAAKTEANRLGFDEALVLNEHSQIVEGSAENLIAVYNGEVFIPGVASDALGGITLRTAIEILKDNNIPIRFESLDRSMVYTCDELLLTGTAANIVYTESVDERLIGKEMGPICKLLKKEFAEILNGTHKRSSELITIITL